MSYKNFIWVVYCCVYCIDILSELSFFIMRWGLYKAFFSHAFRLLFGLMSDTMILGLQLLFPYSLVCLVNVFV
jgi:hypothetical protein